MKKIIRVPYISQSFRWPTGCESVSTVMLLQYLGVTISVDKFITAMPKAELIVKNGVSYAPAPDHFFIGSPYDDQSLGCYPGVIVQTVQYLLKKNNLKLKVADITGMPMSEMMSRYLIQDIPVLLWATIDMKESYPGPSWKLNDSGKTFVWKSNEHCLCFVGFDEDGYYFNDPWDNHGLIRYERALVEQRHREMNGMAVVIQHA